MRFVKGQVALIIGDRKHWELDAWRLNVSRWCPGAPDCLPGVAHRRHRIRIRIWRRTWSARYDDARQSWSPHDR